MLIEASPTIVYASSWYQTILLGCLGTAFAGVLTWIGLRLVSKVDGLTEEMKNYRRKEDCRKCDPVPVVVQSETSKELATSIQKINTDIFNLTLDMESLKRLTT